MEKAQAEFTSTGMFFIHHYYFQKSLNYLILIPKIVLSSQHVQTAAQGAARQTMSNMFNRNNSEPRY